MREGSEAKIPFCYPRRAGAFPQLFCERWRCNLVHVECLLMIKSMMVVFVLLEVDVTLAQFQGNEMSPGLFQDFMVFIPGVTQENQDVGHFKISCCCFGVNQDNWEAGELEIPLCNSSSGKLLRLFFVLISCLVESHLNFCQISTMEILHKNSQLPQHIDYFCKKGLTTDVWLDSKCASDWRCCKCGMQVDCKCMEFVT